VPVAVDPVYVAGNWVTRLVEMPNSVALVMAVALFADYPGEENTLRRHAQAKTQRQNRSVRDGLAVGNETVEMHCLRSE